MKFTTVIFAGLLSIPFPATAAQWYLVMAEKSELYSAIAAHRLETSLIQSSVNQVSVWVRTDFIRPKQYKYPEQPKLKGSNLIPTDAFIWEKDRYLVDCKLQQINITEGSYMLAGESIEWASNQPRTISITPDSFSEIVFKLVCTGQGARPTADIQNFAKRIEEVLLPDPEDQNSAKKEQNVPRIRI